MESGHVRPAHGSHYKVALQVRYSHAIAPVTRVSARHAAALNVCSTLTVPNVHRSTLTAWLTEQSRR